MPGQALAAFSLPSHPPRNPSSYSPVAIQTASRPGNWGPPPLPFPHRTRTAMARSLLFAMLFAALPAAAQDLEVSPVAGSIHTISGQAAISASPPVRRFPDGRRQICPAGRPDPRPAPGSRRGELKFLLNTHFTVTTPAAMRCSASKLQSSPTTMSVPG